MPDAKAAALVSETGATSPDQMERQARISRRTIQSTTNPQNHDWSGAEGGAKVDLKITRQPLPDCGMPLRRSALLTRLACCVASVTRRLLVGEAGGFRRQSIAPRLTSRFGFSFGLGQAGDLGRKLLLFRLSPRLGLLQALLLLLPLTLGPPGKTAFVETEALRGLCDNPGVINGWARVEARYGCSPGGCRGLDTIGEG